MATTGNFITTYVAPGAGGLRIAARTGLRSGWPALRRGLRHQRHPPLRQPGQLPGRPGHQFRLVALQVPIGMVFDAQGGLLVSSRDGNAVDQYDSGVVVTLSAASPSPVSVQYATADGTAIGWHGLHGTDRHRYLRAGPNFAADPARDPGRSHADRQRLLQCRNCPTPRVGRPLPTATPS